MYSIVDNEGNVYAHDIEGKGKAELILADTTTKLKKEKGEEISNLELEIIEQ